jgi:5'-deoxynucleotidase YfbR-like HD superfamily hydrolase
VAYQENVTGQRCRPSQFHVAWFAYLLAEAHEENGGDRLAINGIADVVMAALAHDLAEHVTGDIPGDFKRVLRLREQFGGYEIDLFKQVQLSNFAANLYEPGERIIKFADMLEGLWFAIGEAALGNRRVGVVFSNYRAYVANFAPLNEMETALVEYADYLWAHYGRTLETGQYLGSVPGWGRTSHTLETLEDQTIMGTDEHDGLVGALRREEAEGRATPGPQSEPPIRGDASVPEAPADEPVDDRAQPDLAVERHSSPANARQHGGDHYKGVGYEHWDLVLDTGMNYFQGCATKYVTRWRKHEAGETNLLKAIHYIDKLEEAQAAGRIKPEGVHTVSDIVSFGVANGLNELELQVIKDVVGWRLDNARKHLERLRAGYTELERTNERAFYSQND